MEVSIYLRFLAALIFILSLIGLIYMLIRRFGLNRFYGGFGGGNRIQIIESKRVDARHQLVLFKLDNTEYLILVSPDNGTILEHTKKHQTHQPIFDEKVNNEHLTTKN